MKVLYLNAGNETGGGMYHILRMLHRMKQDNSIPFILGVMEKKELYKRATAAKIETVYFKSESRLSVPLLQKIARFIKTKRITHVHTHGPRATVYMNMIKRIVNVRWVVTVHSDPFFDFKERGMYGNVLTRLHVQALKNAEQIISVSNTFHRSFLEAGIPQKSLRTIHNGIDFNEAFAEVVTSPKSFKKSLGFSADDFLFIKVARLEHVKGHHMALLAFAKVIQTSGQQVHLLLLGDGKLRTSLESLVRTMQLENNVHFYGERKDVHSFYDIADVTLLTSLSESFPYVLLESARAKTPIIATDVGDINYLLHQRELGWKITPGDIGGCVRAMEEAIRLHQEGKLQNIGQNLYKYASTHFSIDKCVNEVYNVYSSM